MKILVTGASGFIGKNVVQKAISLGFVVNTASRSPQKCTADVTSFVVDSVDEYTNWNNALKNCEAVIHLAARVHITRELVENSLFEFRKVNVIGTINLARQAASVGVRRFIFVSSIGVNGSETFEQPYSPDDIASPHSAYSISKYEAELALMNLSSQTGMEVVIVRPPLVYGPKAPGNFGLLLRFVSSGIPLPFGSINNKRSFVSLDNLTDFLFICLQHPHASGQIFLVSDGEDVSTSEFLRRTAQAMGSNQLLFPIPVFILKFLANLMGKRDMSQRLFGSLQVDITKSRCVLGWAPTNSLDEGLKKAVKDIYQ